MSFVKLLEGTWVEPQKGSSREPEVSCKRRDADYEAELQHQGVDPRKKNLLTVKLPDKSKVRFRLQKIVFIDPAGSR